MRVIAMLAASVAFVATACSDPADSPAGDTTASPPPASSLTVSVTPHAYHSDVENTVVLAMRRDNTGEDLLRQIDIVAKRHGLEDWTTSDETFRAIGAGMREAAVASDRAASVAELVSGGDAPRRQLVLEAYGG